MVHLLSQICFPSWDDKQYCRPEKINLCTQIWCPLPVIKTMWWLWKGLFYQLNILTGLDWALFAACTYKPTGSLLYTLQPEDGTICFFKMFISTYKTTKCQNPEDHSLNESNYFQLKHTFKTHLYLPVSFQSHGFLHCLNTILYQVWDLHSHMIQT